MSKIHLDFETRSEVDIVKQGGWVYSRHPSTEILCCAYAIDGEPVQLAKGAEELRDSGLLDYFSGDELFTFIAHNALFEQCIWQNVLVARYGFPEIPIENWRCTAAKAAAMGLPRDLFGVGAALDLHTQKDDEGRKVMLRLSKPRKRRGSDELSFWTPEEDPDGFEKLYAYCMCDVEVEREVDERLPDLSAFEQRVWFIDQKMNLRGVQTDIPAINQINEFIKLTAAELKEEFQYLTSTDGLESPTQVKALLEWLDGEGLELPNLQAATVDRAIARETSPDIKRVLELRRMLAKPSTAKFDAMMLRADPEDGRLRDNLMYHGAGTGRWTAKGVQLQNLLRSVVNSDTAIDCIMLGDYDWFRGAYRDPMAVYSSCTRGVLTASEGRELYVGDYSAIEAMVLPWLADVEEKLDIFRTGQDVYCHAATTIYARPITPKNKPERAVGKVSELALGYGGGINAYGTMARGYGVDIAPAYDALWPTAEEHERERAILSYDSYIKRCEQNDVTEPLDKLSGLAADIIKQRWRLNNPEIVQLWYDVERAAIEAVLTGEKQYAAKCTFGVAKGGDFLLCKLPSGKCISYAFPKVTNADTPWGEKKKTLTYMRVNPKTKNWERMGTYGGKLVENITQATAREILAAAMVRLDDAGFTLILTVHDEVISDELLERDDLALFTEIMAFVPPWAKGLPIKVESWKGRRYRK
jgi:DNA polymerase